jgi:hypothetical protein
LVGISSSAFTFSENMKTFSELYGDIIFPFVEKYKTANNDKGRKAIVKNASGAVLKSREELEGEGIDLPKDLETVCTFIKYLSFYTDALFFRLLFDT